MPQKPSTQAKAPFSRKEWKRLQLLCQHEEAAYTEGFSIIAGVDEAGRGPLAGPVVAAACIIPKGIFFEGINDSKKLLPKKRQQIYQQIINDQRVSYGIGLATSEEIDEINIYQATIVAMQRAVAKLSTVPHLLLVDGKQKLKTEIPSKYIVGGDAASQIIAAASIIAKETRDTMMMEFDKQWPQYAFSKHKGYGTSLHLKALEQHGPCPIHRRSFEPVKAKE